VTRTTDLYLTGVQLICCALSSQNTTIRSFVVPTGWHANRVDIADTMPTWPMAGTACKSPERDACEERLVETHTRNLKCLVPPTRQDGEFASDQTRPQTAAAACWPDRMHAGTPMPW